MFDSIKNFAASLDGKSLAIGAVLGAVTLGAVSVAYCAFSGKDEDKPIEPEAPKAESQTETETQPAEDKPADESATA